MKLFGKARHSLKVGLKPFVLRIQDGFLVGVAPSTGGPCSDCVARWLRERNGWVEPAQVSDLTVRRDVLPDLLTESDPHVMYEVTRDGVTTRLDCAIFPHPDCGCSREGYVPPATWSEKTNFAFSPLFTIKCVRYGTPEGNLWLTAAAGEAPVARQLITAYGVSPERELSRFQAVEEWMKKAALADLPIRVARNASLACESFQTGAPAVAPPDASALTPEGLGAGKTRDEAILDGLLTLAKGRTLRKFAHSMKNPMLVVGANNWIRQQVPFFLLQHYDLHLLFYPNSTPAWVVGVAALSRIRTDEAPTFVFAADRQVGPAFKKALHRILETCRPSEWRGEGEPEAVKSRFDLNSRASEREIRHLQKLNMWWTHWIYRCPKISLKDMLHLEPYPADVTLWRDYFRDGQEPISCLNLHHDWLPRELRHLVKLTSPETVKRPSRNVNGIGTWSFFQDALA